MKSKIRLLAVLMLGFNLNANDDDLFDDVTFEYDPTFADDFELMDQPESAPADRLVVESPHLDFVQDGFNREERSISLATNNETIGQMNHLSLFPQAHFKVMKVNGQLGMPLRFRVYDAYNPGKTKSLRQNGFVSAKEFIRPRPAEFRNVYDAQRFFRHFEVGTSSDPYGFYLSRIHTLSLGQGVIAKEIRPNLLYDHDHLFAQGFYEDHNWRADAFLGPLPLVHMMGANARFAPLDNLSMPTFFREMNFELSYVADFLAPNQKNEYEQSGLYLLSDDLRTIDRNNGVAQAYSLSTVFNYMPISWMSLNPYLSYGHLFLSGLKRFDQELPFSQGAGLHLGNDFTFYFSQMPRSQLFFRTEARFFSAKYWPGYFDSSYMADRLTMEDNRLSKSLHLATQFSDAFRYGYLFELGCILQDQFAAKISYENARQFRDNKHIKPMRKMRVKTSYFGIERLNIFASYEATSISEMKDLFDFEKSSALLSLSGQVKVLSYLYLDAWVKHAFGIKDFIANTDAKNRDNQLAWLGEQGEQKSLNFGLGVEFALNF